MNNGESSSSASAVPATKIHFVVIEHFTNQPFACSLIKQQLSWLEQQNIPTFYVSNDLLEWFASVQGGFEHPVFAWLIEKEKERIKLKNRINHQESELHDYQKKICQANDPDKHALRSFNQNIALMKHVCHLKNILGIKFMYWITHFYKLYNAFHEYSNSNMFITLETLIKSLQQELIDSAIPSAVIIINAAGNYVESFEQALNKIDLSTIDITVDYLRILSASSKDVKSEDRITNPHPNLKLSIHKLSNSNEINALLNPIQTTIQTMRLNGSTIFNTIKPINVEEFLEYYRLFHYKLIACGFEDNSPLKQTIHPYFNREIKSNLAQIILLLSNKLIEKKALEKASFCLSINFEISNENRIYWEFIKLNSYLLKILYLKHNCEDLFDQFKTLVGFLENTSTLSHHLRLACIETLSRILKHFHEMYPHSDDELQRLLKLSFTTNDLQTITSTLEALLATKLDKAIIHEILEQSNLSASMQQHLKYFIKIFILTKNMENSPEINFNDLWEVSNNALDEFIKYRETIQNHECLTQEDKNILLLQQLCSSHIGITLIRYCQNPQSPIMKINKVLANLIHACVQFEGHCIKSNIAKANICLKKSENEIKMLSDCLDKYSGLFLMKLTLSENFTQQFTIAKKLISMIIIGINAELSSLIQASTLENKLNFLYVRYICEYKMKILLNANSIGANSISLGFNEVDLDDCDNVKILNPIQALNVTETTFNNRHDIVINLNFYLFIELSNNELISECMKTFPNALMHYQALVLKYMAKRLLSINLLYQISNIKHQITFNLNAKTRNSTVFLLGFFHGLKCANEIFSTIKLTPSPKKTSLTVDLSANHQRITERLRSINLSADKLEENFDADQEFAALKNLFKHFAANFATLQSYQENKILPLEIIFDKTTGSTICLKYTGKQPLRDEWFKLPEVGLSEIRCNKLYLTPDKKGKKRKLVSTELILPIPLLFQSQETFSQSFKALHDKLVSPLLPILTGNLNGGSSSSSSTTTSEEPSGSKNPGFSRADEELYLMEHNARPKEPKRVNDPIKTFADKLNSAFQQYCSQLRWTYDDKNTFSIYLNEPAYEITLPDKQSSTHTVARDDLIRFMEAIQFKYSLSRNGFRLWFEYEKLSSQMKNQLQDPYFSFKDIKNFLNKCFPQNGLAGRVDRRNFPTSRSQNCT